MDEQKKNKSGVIKAGSALEYSSYDFLSFSEKRNLEDHILQLEEALKREKRNRAEDQQHFDKQLLQNDVAFQDALNKEKKTAYDKGFAAGKAEGVKAGEQSVFAATEYLKECGNKLINFKATFLKEAEESAIKLTLAVAKKIIEKINLENDDVVLVSISKALRQISDRTGVVLKISEADLLIVKDKLPQLKASFDDLSQVRIVLDDKVTKGGVIIETNSGNIDARLEVQLEEILTQLLDNVE